MMIKVGRKYINGLKTDWIYKMIEERIGLEIYMFVIHRNLNYHCILFEEKGLQFVLPFEAKIEEIISN